MRCGSHGWTAWANGLTIGGRGAGAEANCSGASARASPLPVAKADLKAMSPKELEAEKEKIMAEVKADPRIQSYFNFTPEEKGNWFADHQHQYDRVLDIDEELAARLAREQAVRA